MTVNPKIQISLIIVSTVLAGLSLAAIVSYTDPKNSGVTTFIFLYLSLFLLGLGGFTLLGLSVRQALWPGKYISNLSHSFRQSLLLSIIIAVSFWLQGQKILFWWVELSLILFMGAIEAFLNLKV